MDSGHLFGVGIRKTGCAKKKVPWPLPFFFRFSTTIPSMQIGETAVREGPVEIRQSYCVDRSGPPSTSWRKRWRRGRA